jgi:hypothetical protein
MEGLIFLLLIFWLASGGVAASVASAKGWSGSSWFWAGFLLGPAGLLGAVGMPDRLMRKYIRQIAAKQDAIGSELVTNTFRTSVTSGDEIWAGIIECFNPAIAASLSRSNSTMWPRIVEIRDVEGFAIGKATAKGDAQDGQIDWIITLVR